MGTCFTIKDAIPKDRTLGYTMDTGSDDFPRNLRLMNSQYYEVTDYTEASTGGVDYGYCAAINEIPGLVSGTDYDTLYQAKWNGGEWYFQGHNACNTDGCAESEILTGGCTLFPEYQQPLCYLLTENGKNKLCATVDGDVNPIYFATFGGNVSYQSLLLFYPLILLLSICIFANMLCCKPKLIWGKMSNKYRSVNKRKINVAQDEDEECRQEMLSKDNESDDDL